MKLSSTFIVKTSLPDARPQQTYSQAPWCLTPAYVSAEQHFHGVNVNYNRGSASGRGPTRGGQRHWRLKKKRQRRKHTHHWQQFTRAQLPGSRFPAKFGYQPIKLERDPFTHTYPANCVRVHFRPLGVYKESRVAH